MTIEDLYKLPEISDSLDYSVVLSFLCIQLYPSPHTGRELSSATEPSQKLWFALYFIKIKYCF